MARQPVAGIVHDCFAGFEWFMGQAKGPKCGFRRKLGDGKFRGWGTGVPIMVAGYKTNVELRMTRTPDGKLGKDAVAATFFGVVEIAQDDQTLDGVVLDESVESGQIVVHHFGRDGDPCAVKCGRLAEVRIGDEECLLCGPKECAGRVEFYRDARCDARLIVRQGYVNWD